MLRLLWCLPICLLLQDQRPAAKVPAGQGAACLAPLPDELQPSLASFAWTTGHGFPVAPPWAALHHIGSREQDAVSKLLRSQPTAFLQKCLERYDREIHGYSCVLAKHERVAGKLRKPEQVLCHFRERPFSVFMEWQVLGDSRAKKMLYVAGENQDKMLVRPAGLLLSFAGVVPIDMDSADSKSSGRYNARQFGMRRGMQDTLDAMLKAQERGVLHLSYEGITRVPETGHRPCFKLRRFPYDPPEGDGVADLVIYIDTETGLQVGSVLKDTNGQLIGQYFFRDIRLNPEIPDKQFTRQAL